MRRFEEGGVEKQDKYLSEVSTAANNRRNKKMEARSQSLFGTAKNTRALDMIKALQGDKENIGLSDIFKSIC